MNTAVFPEGISEITILPLTQWDKGQKLKIYGLEDTVCQVHFCDKTCKESIVYVAYKVDDYYEVSIPNSLLENDYDIHAYIYQTSEESGRTIKIINIPVNGRVKPEDFISEPDATQTEILEEMIAYTNKVGALVEEYRTFSDIRVLTSEEFQLLKEVEEDKVYVISNDNTLINIQNKDNELEGRIDDLESRMLETNGTWVKVPYQNCVLESLKTYEVIFYDESNGVPTEMLTIPPFTVALSSASEDTTQYLPSIKANTETYMPFLEVIDGKIYLTIAMQTLGGVFTGTINYRCLGGVE